MSRWTSALVLLLLAASAAAEERYPGVGRAATPAEIAAWDIDVRPDFKGLPPGKGSVREGEELWEAKCTSCHGTFGESNATFPPIAGGTTAEDIKRGRVAALAKSGEARSTLMKLSRISALWDYINRAMPWNNPKTLSADEVYALVAYILNLGRIVPDDFELSDRNIAEVQNRLPNRDGMVRHPALWDVRGEGDVKNTACMADCPVKGDITSSLPEHARGAHGNLAAQNRIVGPVRGLGATVPAATVSPAQVARSLAQKNGCLACHGATQKLVGPPIADIASRYAKQSGAETQLLAKVRLGGQGAWGSVPMPPQSHLPEADIRAILRWMLTGD